MGILRHFPSAYPKAEKARGARGILDGRDGGQVRDAGAHVSAEERADVPRLHRFKPIVGDVVAVYEEPVIVGGVDLEGDGIAGDPCAERYREARQAAVGYRREADDVQVVRQGDGQHEAAHEAPRGGR